MTPPPSLAPHAAFALAVELSTRAGTVALCTPDGSAGEEPLEPGAAHASDLLPAIERLARRLGAADFAERPRPDVVVVGLGPGSFTGLRVATASALGLARAANARLVGLPSSDAWFAATLGRGERGTLVLDARAEQAYLARAERRADGALLALEAPAAWRWDALFERLAVLAERGELGRVFADAGARERLATLQSAAAWQPEDAGTPRAATLLELGLTKLEREGATDARDLRPLYLMPFAAR